MIRGNNIESLEDASRRIYPVSVQDLSPSTKRNAFKVGAAWQEQQYESLIQSHAELLEIAQNALTFIADLNGCNWIPTEDLGSMEMKRRSISLQHQLYKSVQKPNSITNQQK